MNRSDASDHIYISKGLGVKEYAYYEDMNSSFRRTMEDGYMIVDNFLGDGKSILFGVFDGHGGRDVVDIVVKEFPKEFQSQYTASQRDVKSALEKTFTKIDNSLKGTASNEVGSTACVGLILFEAVILKGKKVLYIANVGDTRAVVGQMSAYKRVSYDHKASDSNEIARVKKEGGNIFLNRVEGVLAITRAFGDHLLKDKGVTAVPYIERLELRSIDKFLVVATDGLWDVCTDQEAISLIKDKDGALEMAKTLVNTALKNFSKDNIGVMVLVLN